MGGSIHAVNGKPLAPPADDRLTKEVKMKNTLWTTRTFWDGTKAIFLKNNAGMSCYDLDSEELGDIIQSKMDDCTAQMNEWLDLKRLRMEHENGKESD